MAFFGDADSYQVITRGTSIEELHSRLRVACLLYDHVLLAAAYFWQSTEMSLTMKLLKPYMEAGHILPVIRSIKDTEDPIEYYETRRSETAQFKLLPVYNDPALASEVALRRHRPVAKTLNEVGSYVYIDQKSVGAEFRDLWEADCFNQSDPFSIYNLIHTNQQLLGHGILADQVRDIAKRSYFSRNVAITQVEALGGVPLILEQAIIRRVSDLYLLANANACGSDLLARSNAFSSTAGMGSHRLLGPLALANVELFVRALTACGISSASLGQLSDHELLFIKSSPEFVEFRETYIGLVQQAKAEEELFADRAWQMFTRRKRSDRARRYLVSVLRNMERISAFVFVGAFGAVISESTPTVNILLASSGASASLSSILRRIDTINRYPIESLRLLVAQGEYKKRMQRLFPEI